MTRFLLLPTILLTLTLAAAISLIHAQPYDAGGLRAFLFPANGCAPPCFIGIRVGSMTTGQVIEWLEKHPWVQRVLMSERFGATQRGFIGWEWNGQQPALLDGDAAGALWIHEHQVRFVRVQTTIPFGSLWLLLDEPPIGLFRVERDFASAGPIIIHYAAYPEMAVMAQLAVSCPLRPAEFWMQPVLLQYYVELSEPFDDYDLRGWLHESVC
ncbi:MAG: hypothetical protein HXY41_07245 [Chloroflexi bacterium]|nr:hypothetical protein [Chloroflexota bacterium]